MSLIQQALDKLDLSRRPKAVLMRWLLIMAWNGTELPAVFSKMQDDCHNLFLCAR